MVLVSIQNRIRFDKVRLSYMVLLNIEKKERNHAQRTIEYFETKNSMHIPIREVISTSIDILLEDIADGTAFMCRRLFLL